MKKKILLTIFILILVIVVSVLSMYFYKYNLLKKIGNADLEFTKASNFYFEVKPESTNSTPYDVKEQLYVKDNKSARLRYTNNDELSERYYIDLDNKTMNIVSENDKSYRKIESDTFVGYNGLTGLPSLLNYANSLVNNEYTFTDKIKVLSELSKISTETVNETKCISICLTNKDEEYSEKVWLNNESLLPVKVEVHNTDGVQVMNYTFEKGTVKDENVTFADIDNYNSIETN